MDQAQNKWDLGALTRLIYDTLRLELLSVEEGFLPGSDLIGAGLDSLSLTQLLLSVEENTGFWLDESELTPEVLASCESLASCIHERLPSP